MKTSFQYICFGAVAMALSGCALPNYPKVKEVEQPVAQVVKKPVYTAPVTTQAATTTQVEVEEEVKPKSRWAHQPIGNTGNASDGNGGSDLGGGDEDGGWG